VAVVSGAALATDGGSQPGSVIAQRRKVKLDADIYAKRPTMMGVDHLPPMLENRSCRDLRRKMMSIGFCTPGGIDLADRCCTLPSGSF
jgi:hypothetical protein